MLTDTDNHDDAGSDASPLPADTPTTITIVHCWSAPRSRSTALLYSFEARCQDGDTVALDEPLYRRWLCEKLRGGAGGDGDGGVTRPYAAALLRGAAPGGGAGADDAWRWEREKQVGRLDCDGQGHIAVSATH